MMKLDQDLLTYEFHGNNPETDDISKIIMFYGEEKCGHIVLEEKWGLQKFEDFFEEDDLYDKFIWEKYLYIDEIHVINGFREQGIGNKLMVILFEEIIPKYFKSYNLIVLWVNPWENNISLKLLKKFYQNYGFSNLNIKQCKSEENHYQAKIINQ